MGVVVVGLGVVEGVGLLGLVEGVGFGVVCWRRMDLVLPFLLGERVRSIKVRKGFKEEGDLGRRAEAGEPRCKEEEEPWTGQEAREFER